MSAKVRHPARFSDTLLDKIASVMPAGPGRILDPFGGTGRTFELEKLCPGWTVECVEIEPEWAECNPRTIVGNALHLPFEDGSFDAIVTSPTYGNRMADHHNASDDSRRNTYKHTLGHDLDPDNSGILQWGNEYRVFHEKAWREARRVLVRDGLFILNCKNHIRGGVEMAVTEWHIFCLESIGFRTSRMLRVFQPGNRFGANGNLRIEYETIAILRRI